MGEKLSEKGIAQKKGGGGGISLKEVHRRGDITREMVKGKCTERENIFFCEGENNGGKGRKRGGGEIVGGGDPLSEKGLSQEKEGCGYIPEKGRVFRMEGAAAGKAPITNPNQGGKRHLLEGC